MDKDLVSSVVPYKKVRLLQNAFNDSVRGDVLVQKKIPYIVKKVGLQLRETDIDEFADHRNVDAVLIYTIISKNISILDYLISKDKKGYFNIDIVSALQKYVSGEFKESIEALSKIKDKYKDNTEITPYLHIIMGNAMMSFSSQKAVKFFDNVRLTSPGTFLEEIALRYLLEIKLNKDVYLDECVFGYIRSYITKFYYSIYKDRFINFLLHFLFHNKCKLNNEEILFIMSFLSLEDQRVIYFKIAQKAVILGKGKIGFLAVSQLKKISSRLDYKDLNTIQLYENILNIPFVDIISLQLSTYNIPYYFLDIKDINLKKSAEFIMSEMAQSLINIDFNYINKDFPLYKKEHENMNLNLDSFIKKNRQKVEGIESLLKEER
ncbi:chemotaxis protein [Candidatus Liberibacter brunswickensis]|uniref:chemotaxis protein n=1 Tax=Candidatus Liberibacter brunswickensis TaxID=1968796 RepID=UPI002FDFECDA